MTLKEAFFKDLARHLTTWRDDVVHAIEEPSTATWAESQPAIERLHRSCSNVNAEDLREVLNECLRGLLHSTLVTIDGGTDISAAGRLELIDGDTRQPLTTGALHEEFFEYLASEGLI